MKTRLPRKLRSNGFSVILVVVVLATVTAVGAVGWFASNKDSDKNQDSANNSQQPNTKPDDPTESSKYLVIKEWNLRITLPEQLRGDISYFINDRAHNDFGGPILVDFTSKKFSAGALKCAEIEADTPRSLVSIYEEGEGEETMIPQPFKKIRDKRYYFAGGACEETIASEGSNEDKQLLNDLKAAVANTLEVYDE